MDQVYINISNISDEIDWPTEVYDQLKSFACELKHLYTAKASLKDVVPTNGILTDLEKKLMNMNHKSMVLYTKSIENLIIRMDHYCTMNNTDVKIKLKNEDGEITKEYLLSEAIILYDGEIGVCPSIY
jgi:hypothetical protein